MVVAQKTVTVLTEFVTAFVGLLALGTAVFMLSSGSNSPAIVLLAVVLFVFAGTIVGQLLFDSPVLVSGRDHTRARHWIVFVGGFLALLLVMEATATFIVGLEFGGLTGIPDSIVTVIVFGGPFLVSASSAYLEGGVLASFVIGAVPSIYVGVRALIGNALGILTSAPESSWIFVLFIGPLFTLPAALAGFVVGAGVRLTVDKIHRER